MNAGTLTVAVQGDFSAFLAQMSKLQQAAEAEAKRVGDVVSSSMTTRIGDGLGKVKDDIVKTAEQIPKAAEKALPKVVKEVEKTAKTSKTIFEREFGNEKIGALFGRMIGLGMVDNILRQLTDGLKAEKSIGQIFGDFVKSLPIIGPAFELGKELGTRFVEGISNTLNDKGTQTRAEAAALLSIKQEEEARFANEQKMREARAKARREEAAAEYEAKIDSLSAASDLEESLRRDSVKMQVEAARESGDERKAIELELNEELRLLGNERIQALGATGADESAFNRARDVFKKREEMIRETAARRVRQVEKDEKESNDRIAKDKADKEKDLAEKAAKDRQKLLEEIEKETSSLEQRRITQGAAGISSAQTALGQFTFDAYPDQQKRKNDEAIVKQITELNRKAGLVGGFA